jgi:acetate---CoA ligase (ADP-forming)
MATNGRVRLRRILYPESVVVVGASRDPTKRGHQVVRALQRRGYEGRVQAVNPRGEEVLGIRACASVEEVPEAADLAVICTPAPTVPDLVAACGRRGVAGAVVLAAGFRELGEDGLALEERLRVSARETGIRVIGPNTSGLMNLGIGLDLIGIPGARPGRLALLAQSGNALLDLVTDASERPGEAFSLALGVGNEVDVGFHEYLAVVGRDPDVGAILVHAESFRDGASFLAAARRVTPHIPIVVLKGGRTRAGDQAAYSHTGAVATDHVVVRSALRQAGIVEVLRSDDLLPVGRTLESQPPACTGEGMVILADGGGHGTLAADTLEELGVSLAPIPERARARLRELLGGNAALGNPVDLAGAADRDPSIFAGALEILLGEPGISGVIVVSLFGGYAIRFAEELEEGEAAAAGDMAALARSADKPLVIHSIYGDSGSRPVEVLRTARVPVFRSVEVACRAAAALWERGRMLRRLEAEGDHPDIGGPLPVRHSSGEPAPANGPAAPPPAPHPILEGVRDEGRIVLLESEVRELLTIYLVPLVPGVLCGSGAEVGDAFRRFGPPVVVKAVSATVTHKSEAGGVALGLNSAEEAVEGRRRVLASVESYARNRGWEPDLRGVLVSPMLPAPEVELLAGVRRDRSFGPVLTLGAGGVEVEVHRDVAVRVLPVHDGEVDEMISQLRIAPLIRGHRGRPGVDVPALAGLLRGLARCILENPEIAELEMNPVFAGPDGVMGVDARAVLDAPAGIMTASV